MYTFCGVGTQVIYIVISDGSELSRILTNCYKMCSNAPSVLLNQWENDKNLWVLKMCMP